MERIVIIQFIGILALGALFGGLLGYYGKCTSGACVLTATPKRGAIYGMVLAGLFAFPMLTNRAAIGSVAPEDSDVIHIDSVAAFEQQVLQAGKPVLVDFYSTTCGPCRRLSPTIEKLATQYKDRANVVKVNVDKVPELAGKYNINAIPAIVIFSSDGTETKRIIGYNAKKTYTAALDELLS